MKVIVKCPVKCFPEFKVGNKYDAKFGDQLSKEQQEQFGVDDPHEILLLSKKGEYCLAFNSEVDIVEG